MKAGEHIRTACGDECAVAFERRSRTVGIFGQPLQPFVQRHRPGGRIGRRDQNAFAAVGKIKPRAGAGHEHAERRAKAAQTFQPDRAIGQQPVRQLGDLTAMRVGRTEDLAARRAPERPNKRAPTGLAHSTRVPSVDHSQAGWTLVACNASRGSSGPRALNSVFCIVSGVGFSAAEYDSVNGP